MARLLAIDYGTKRTGLAVTDPGQLIATALDTVASHQFIPYLQAYLAREVVEGFVLGIPIDSAGVETNNTQHAKGAATLLRKHFPEIPIYLIDERYTSRMAQQAMLSSGLGKKARQDKGTVDRIAAVILLQDFLERRQYAQGKAGDGA